MRPPPAPPIRPPSAPPSPAPGTRKAPTNLLAAFHYLSTVSGGGYIGSWLQTLIKEKRLDGAIAILQQDRAPEIAELGKFTSYLTPKVGLFSADTWAGIVLYARNLLINWLVVLPAFMVVTLLAIIDRTAFFAVMRPDPAHPCTTITIETLFHPALGTHAQMLRAPAPCTEALSLPGGLQGWFLVACMTVAGFCLFFGALYAALLLPSHQPAATDRTLSFVRPRKIRSAIIIPGLVWAVATPLSIAPWYELLTAGPWPWTAALPFGFWLVLQAGFAVAALCSIGRNRSNALVPAVFTASCLAAAIAYFHFGLSEAATAACGTVVLAGAAILMAFLDRHTGRRAGAFVVNLWAWITACAAGALVIGIGQYLAQSVPADLRAERMVAFAPAWLILSQVLVSTVYVGLRREVPLAELDREWLALVSALKLRVAILWAAYVAATLILSRTQLYEGGSPGSLAGALGAGPLAAWLGKQALARLGTITGSKGFQIPWTLLLNLLALVFAAAVAAFLGAAADAILANAQAWLAPPGPEIPVWAMVTSQFILLAILVGVTWFHARRVDVNRFSMHAVYRNRLTRAFLGATRLDPPRDPFTRFDESRPLRLHELAATPRRRLFPVLGMTLNITVHIRTDWAERKGASFTATPLFCGAGYMATLHGKTWTGPSIGAYACSRTYAGPNQSHPGEDPETGLSLATAMTISGAAVSPNWGYHSSPAMAFLMSMFNVRLGAWLPNPASATGTTLTQSQPTNALYPYVRELVGLTDDTHDDIYLSDGGHFDNLGLYEMLRRRCPVILVIDADADPDAQLFDLGNALRQAQIDFDVEVALETRLHPLKDRGTDPLGGVAFGTITYPETDPRTTIRRTGVLLVIKPDRAPAMPATVRAYANGHPTFPHQDTKEQWFTESQFESYRALGQFQMDQLLDQAAPALAVILDPTRATRSDWPAACACLQKAVLAPPGSPPA